MCVGIQVLVFFVMKNDIPKSSICCYPSIFLILIKDCFVCIFVIIFDNIIIRCNKKG